MDLSRRIVLKGIGASIALPWLCESSAACSEQQEQPPKRIAFGYIPNGVIGSKWFPTTTGSDFNLPSSLKPLESVRSELTLLSGLNRTYASGSDPHSQSGSCWMTSSPPTEQLDGKSPINRTLDQIIAAKHHGSTPFPSLELSCNSFTDNRESRSFDSISWYAPGHDARSEKDPVNVFRRLFGRPQGLRKSVLDAVVGQSRSLQRRLGKSDRARVEEYMGSIRSIEKRIEIQKRNTARLTDFKFEAPTEIPADRGAYIRLMMDLMLMAFQSDSTRIASLMVGPERWAAPQMYQGVFDKPVDHHTMTHDRSFDDQVAMLDQFHMEQFAYMIEEMKRIKERNGESLMDNTLLVVGSGLGDGAEHSLKDLPLLLAGAQSIGIPKGHHLKAAAETPLANLWLRIANQHGLNLESFADSTGELNIG